MTNWTDPRQDWTVNEYPSSNQMGIIGDDLMYLKEQRDEHENEINALDSLVDSNYDTLVGLGDITNHAPKIAYASGSLTLSTSFQDVPGCSITVPRNGVYRVVIVACAVSQGSGDNAQQMLATMGGSPGDQSQEARFIFCDLDAIAHEATVTQQYIVTLSNGNTIKLRAKKSGGSGSSFVRQTHSSITIDMHSDRA